MSVLSDLLRRMHSTTEVTPELYQVAIKGVNVFLIVEEELTLIDTGIRGSGPRIIEVIRQLGRSPEEIGLIVLTHNHIDHMGGLAELKKELPAKVAIHRHDIGLRNDHPSETGVRHRLPLPTFPPDMKKAFSVMEDAVDITLEGGEVLPLMGGLRVIHTPGHTRGSICLYSEEKKLVIVGDVIRKRRKNFLLPPKMVSSDLDLALESVKILSGLEIETICFGHGLPVSGDIRAGILDLIERKGD